MATAMVWTVICDAVPAAERTMAFYTISALGIILSAILNPILNCIWSPVVSLLRYTDNRLACA